MITAAGAWDGPWAGLLARVVDDAHLVTGDQVPQMLDAVLAPFGLTPEVLLADLAQRTLNSVRGQGEPAEVERTLAGLAYQRGEITSGTDERDRQLLWVPMLDGTERVGVLQLTLGEDLVDDAALRTRLWSLAGLMGHVLMAKLAHSDRLRRLRANSLLAPSAELLWQLLPPRTAATPHVVITALLEPHDTVAGDAYDYTLDSDTVELAVFDGVGHDMQSGLTTALAITALRNARRAGITDLADMAARADELITTDAGPRSFVTAVLARLDTTTGELAYLLAGHPPPLLVRASRVVKELDHPPRLPLGVPAGGRSGVGREQLEPGDRLLLYSDGITEARDTDGEFFGEQRLVDFTERASLAQLSAPETLRRLAAAVLEHQDGRLQDDATLLMIDWSANAHRRMAPHHLN